MPKATNGVGVNVGVLVGVKVCAGSVLVGVKVRVTVAEAVDDAVLDGASVGVRLGVAVGVSTAPARVARISAIAVELAHGSHVGVGTHADRTQTQIMIIQTCFISAPVPPR